MHPELLNYLENFVSEHKLQRFWEVLAERTRHLTVVLENLYHSQNASACLRSCDCFGVQDVHIIEDRNAFQVHRDIALGASQWLTIHRYDAAEDNTRACLQALKRRGYRIIATMCGGEACPLEEYDVRHKTALLFGAELDGLSPAALELADGRLTVPLRGFTESLNVSVAAALCLHRLTRKLREAGVNWQLTDREREELRAQWVRSVFRKRFKSHAATVYERCAADAGVPGEGRRNP